MALSSRRFRRCWNMLMRTAVAIRHVAFEDLGLLAPLLAEAGFTTTYREAGVDELADGDRADLLVVLGGPIGAYDDGIYPFLKDELRVLERRLQAGRPTLGICLGAQLMARALGSRVFPGRAREIGWAPLRLTGAGRESCLRHLAPEHCSVLHWHGDTFDLPTGARHLAATEITPHQAFSWGDGGALALQFHAEVEPAALERWLIGHAGEIAATAGVDVPTLRAATARNGAAARRHGRACLAAWLDTVTPTSGSVAARPMSSCTWLPDG